ncbi:MAG: preprotein translocase subunit SecY [Candidatus Latescibacteria bacterium]|nr:preprotein translocase subunit SecY [bacterium]MBD3425440.1 preprotein translocase subunit SecY [Candidatus Latescibacterota bacterium]
MFKKFQDMFSIPELRKRILFTVALLVVYRVGSHITAPGVNPLALKVFFENQKGTIFALYDLFAGGNLSRATIFALGIMPYISASIIMQLLQTVIPYFEKLAKEGEEGRKKITQYTRYGTVLLSVIQAMGISIFLLSMKPGGVSVVTMSPMMFRLLTIITMTAGTIFIMWLGEQISERGIGNGISLIIMIGILARYPGYFLNTWRAIKLGQITAFRLVFLLLIMVGVVAAVILITQGQRRIPVQYAKRIVGNKIYGGTSQYIPLRVNTAGVIPIIFARSIMMFPSTIAMFFKGSATLDYIRTIFAPGTWLYLSLYAVIIIFFTYFYTAIILNPTDMAENMKKYGGFIPGIRPGKRTSDYIDRILTRVTLPGAIFLAFIAILPDILMRRGGLPFYFGGTGVLIIVGVLLDTLKQIETHLLMRHYDGFMKKGKLRGRR